MPCRPLAEFLRLPPLRPRLPQVSLTAPTRAQFRAALTSSASSTQSLSLRSTGSSAVADSSRKPRVRRASYGSVYLIRAEKSGIGKTDYKNNNGGSCT